ncbi:MAG: uroporphyrinogen decarboxylase family protein [Verrucomicrobiota bacterium]
MTQHRPDITVSLNFMPAFYHKHLAVTYGEAYYFDPICRAAVEKAEQSFLFEVLGRYGVGSSHPQPSPNLFIQPVDLIMRTQGAEWRFPKDGTVESWGTPWAGKTAVEISRIDPREAAHHPVIGALIRQYRELTRLYGDKADIFGIKSGVMNVHSPFTTAHQLCGEDLFCMMMTEPENAAIILWKVWDIYRAIFDRLQQETGGRFTSIQVGDCSAALISDSLYRTVVFPVNRKVMTAFAEAGYHSCGPSTHLLNAFAGLPPLRSIELGPGTDLSLGAALLPDVIMCPLVDTTVMRGGTPTDVSRLVAGILKATATVRAVTLCAWAFDRDTPLDNVTALYERVKKTT